MIIIIVNKNLLRETDLMLKKKKKTKQKRCHYILYECSDDVTFTFILHAKMKLLQLCKNVGTM